MISIIAGFLIVVFVTVAIIAKSKKLKLAAAFGLLLVCLIVGGFVLLLYLDPSGL